MSKVKPWNEPQRHRGHGERTENKTTMAFSVRSPCPLCLCGSFHALEAVNQVDWRLARKNFVFLQASKTRLPLKCRINLGDSRTSHWHPPCLSGRRSKKTRMAAMNT